MHQADFPAVYDLIKATGILDVHTPYTYWVLVNQTSGLNFVAEHGGQPAGFITGMGPFREPGEAFVWQVGVRPDLQRQGVGNALLEHFLDAAVSRGFSSVCTTISEDNTASYALFARMARSRERTLERDGQTGTMGDLMQDEVLYRIRLT